tara:strand:- start:74 stop:784 length:711 start_codon:yes stop_codon:yes gene_type:complete
MKKIIQFILVKISRILYYIIPQELISEKKSLNSYIQYNLVKETVLHFEEHIKNSLVFRDTSELREYAIKTSLSNDENKSYYYLEFGVFKGESANFFSKFINKLYCFDSFEGLKEDWGGTILPKGYFNLNKKIPKLNSNVEPIVGWVEDSLDGFLKKYNPKINFVHLDMDTYSPTKFTLEKLKPYLVKNSIIIFDELYNYVGWKNGEYKALKEVFNEDEFEYKAFNLNSEQCVVQIK